MCPSSSIFLSNYFSYRHVPKRHRMKLLERRRFDDFRDVAPDKIMDGNKGVSLYASHVLMLRVEEWTALTLPLYTYRAEEKFYGH